MTSSADLFATDPVEPPYTGSELELLRGWLDYHRDTLARKCIGLDADQLRRRSREPSTLTLHGLVRHMAEVEGWFNDDLTDGPVDPIFYSEADPDGDFDNVADADVVADVTTWRATIARSRAFCAEHGDLEAPLARSSRTGAEISLRWIYLHMLEEYARHNGHADLLREAIDGETGD